MYASAFYDYADNGYFGDFASRSMMNQIEVSRNGSYGSYTDADLVVGHGGNDRRGYGQTGGSNIMLRSSSKSTITALDESNNLGQLSYENLVWTIGENIGWGVQRVDFPGSIAVTGNVTSTSQIKAQRSQSDNNYTTAALWTESYNTTTTGIAFHISGVVGKFLEMRTNGVLYWENGQVWTSSNLTNLNQLSNGPGYLTNGSNPSFSSGFAGYTTDGLFSANARPVTITTPNGDTRIRLGYNDYGGGQYYGRIGFNGPTTWSIGHTGSAGNEFSIGTGYRGDYFKITQSGDYIFESGSGGTSGKVVFKTADNGDLNKYIMQDGYWTVIGTHSNEGLRVRDHNGNILLNVAGSSNGYPLRVGIGTITPGYRLHVAGNMFASSDIHVGADGSTGYVASRVWLYSHDNYRGAGYYMSGTGSTWFAGTPYTNFDGAYMIAKRAGAGAPDAADPSYRLWQVNSVGSTYQTGDLSATSLHAYSATGRVVAGSWNFDGMLFDTSRSALIARGNYPHIELWSDQANENHGGTLRFGGYNNGSSGSYKSWHVGTAASNLVFLDIGYGGSNNSNPHAGIAGLGVAYGYADAFTIMRFHNNGNVGIGNFGTYGTEGAAPAYKLDVRGNFRATDNLTIGTGINSSQYNVLSENQLYRTGGGDLYINNSGSGHVRMVEGGGSLLINTGTKWNQERFGIQISNAAAWASVPAMMRLTNLGSGYRTKITFTDSSIIDGWLGMIPINNGSYFVMGFSGATEEGFKVYQNGNVVAAGDVTAYSDIRVKENIVTVDNALQKTLSLRGVYYNRTDTADKRKKIGVIAQEVQTVAPELVTRMEDDMLNVSYGNMAGLFIEAIKEQQLQIESQKSEIEELKDLVKQLINR